MTTGHDNVDQGRDPVPSKHMTQVYPGIYEIYDLIDGKINGYMLCDQASGNEYYALHKKLGKDLVSKTEVMKFTWIAAPTSLENFQNAYGVTYKLHIKAVCTEDAW